MTGTSLAPAGWYADPADAGGPLRYWDGERWTAWQALDGVMTVRPLSPEGMAAAWDARRDHRAPWPGPAAAVALLALLASGLLAFAFVAAGSALGLDSIAAELVLSSAGLYTGLLGTCVAVQRRWGTDQGFRKDFGLEYRGGDWWRGLLGALAAKGLGVVVSVVLILLFVDELANTTIELDAEVWGWAALVVFVLMALVAAPFVEEVFFRGLLMRSLETVLPSWAAIVVQGIAFGLAHATVDLGVANLLIVVPIGVGGMTLGYLALRYQRLGPGIASHAFFNVVAVLFLVGQFALG
jgi:membrane protease YdiL (CAAX protease family)